MLLHDEKWLNYTVKTIKAIHLKGAGTIATISEEVGGSRTYLAKVIAALRKSGIIDKNYELIRPPEKIMISELLAHSKEQSPIVHNITNIIMNAVSIPITQVW